MLKRFEALLLILWGLTCLSPSLAVAEPGVMHASTGDTVPAARPRSSGMSSSGMSMLFRN